MGLNPVGSINLRVPMRQYLPVLRTQQSKSEKMAAEGDGINFMFLGSTIQVLDLLM